MSAVTYPLADLIGLADLNLGHAIAFAIGAAIATWLMHKYTQRRMRLLQEYIIGFDPEGVIATLSPTAEPAETTPEPALAAPEPDPEPDRYNWLTRPRMAGLDAKPARRPLEAYEEPTQPTPKARKAPAEAGGSKPAPPNSALRDDLVAALKGLGYKAKEARHAADLAMTHNPADLEAGIRLALSKPK